MLACRNTMPRRPPANREPPPELDGTLTAGDLAWELCQLDFQRCTFNAVRIDEDVRDYLVTRLTRQATRRD